jgi:hypothetical protein
MAVKKAVAKRAKKAVARTKTKVGDSYACEVCGLSVIVDDVCGCVDACDIICCETPMKRKRAKK